MIHECENCEQPIKSKKQGSYCSECNRIFYANSARRDTRTSGNNRVSSKKSKSTPKEYRSAKSSA